MQGIYTYIVQIIGREQELGGEERKARGGRGNMQRRREKIGREMGGKEGGDGEMEGED